MPLRCTAEQTEMCRHISEAVLPSTLLLRRAAVKAAGNALAVARIIQTPVCEAVIAGPRRVWAIRHLAAVGHLTGRGQQEQKRMGLQKLELRNPPRTDRESIGLTQPTTVLPLITHLGTWTRPKRGGPGTLRAGPCVGGGSVLVGLLALLG